ALHQPGAAARGLRALGAQIRKAAAQPAARPEERTRRRVSMGKEKASFVYVTFIRATPEKVFEAITKPEIARQYWGHENVSEWRPGAGWQHVGLDAQRTVKVVGKVVEIAPPTRLVISWASPAQADDPESCSRVTFDIAQYDGMVKLTVT